MKYGIAIMLLISLAMSMGVALGQETTYGLKWSYRADGWVRSVAVSGDGRYAAVGADDQNIYLFNSSGAILWKRKIRGVINDVSMSLNASHVAVASSDTNVYVIDKNGSIIVQQDLGSNEVSEVSISKDGRYVAASAKDKVYFLNIKRVVLWSQRVGGDVHGLSVSGNGSLVAVGSEDTNLYLFDRDGRTIWTYDTGNIDISSVSVSDNGEFTVVTTRLNNLYQINNKGVLNWSHHINGNPRYVNILDGDSIAVQTHDNYLYFYSRNGSLSKVLGMNSSFHSLSISGDGSYLAASHGPPSPEIDFFKEEILKSAVENAAIENFTAAKTIPEQEVVVVANSIDFDASLDLFLFLKSRGAKVVHVSATDFVSQYREEKSIVILGGPDAYEGVGGLVREVVSQAAQGMIRQPGSRKMYVKRDIWATGQKVMVIAGSNREETKAAHQENSENIASELGL